MVLLVIYRIFAKVSVGFFTFSESNYFSISCAIDRLVGRNEVHLVGL